METMVPSSYKWMSWVLIVLVIVLSVMLYKSNSQTASDSLEDANMSIKNCREDITTWTTAHPQGSVITAEAKADLEAILGACEGNVQSAQDQI